MRPLLTFVCFSCLGLAQAPQPDFRKAAWGMTQAQVLATEAERPSEIHRSDGEVVVRYDSLKWARFDVRAVYIFAQDKLVRAKYLFNAEHAEENDFIGDFKAITPVLREQYGKPSTDRAYWASDLGQEESKTYLDQDRATPGEILQSDRFVGLAISLGQLKFYTLWTNARTKISHGLTGADHHITHQVEFLSVQFEGLETQVRGSARPADF